MQQAWVDEDVPQCGYCQAGQIMRATSLLARYPQPTDEEIDNGDGRERVPLRHVRPNP